MNNTKNKSRDMENPTYKAALGILLKSMRDGYEENKLVNHQVILTLGPTPQVLINNGMPDLPLAINGRVIDKCFFDHGITKTMLERIYSIIATPKAIYKADINESGRVVMTYEIKDANPIIVAIHSNKQLAGRRDFYNTVASMYDKGGNAEQRWTDAGLLLWACPPPHMAQVVAIADVLKVAKK